MVDLHPKLIDGGWLVGFPSHDMAPVLAAMAEQPAVKIGFSVAGQNFELTPRPEDRGHMW